MSPGHFQDTSLLRPITDSSFDLKVYVQPKASANRIAGLHAGALKICITAPPVDGKANKAIISYLAQFFGLPKTAVSIDSGQHSRTKRVRISGMSPDGAREKITEALGSG
jgi:uncharacterized protein (TIGR00251 family)